MRHLYIFYYAIKEDRIKKIESIIGQPDRVQRIDYSSYRLACQSSDSESSAIIKFFFKVCLPSNRQRTKRDDIASFLKELKGALNSIWPIETDVGKIFICLGIHDGDLGFDSNDITELGCEVFFPNEELREKCNEYQDKDRYNPYPDVEKFIDDIKNTVSNKNAPNKPNVEVILKLFTHQAGSRISKVSLNNPAKFLTLDFQKSVFFCTPEHLETLLFQFRVYVSALEARGSVENLPKTDSVLNKIQRNIMNIIKNECGEFDLWRCETQCLNSTKQSKVENINNKYETNTRDIMDFLSLYHELDEYMRNEILPAIKH